MTVYLTIVDHNELEEFADMVGADNVVICPDPSKKRHFAVCDVSDADVILFMRLKYFYFEESSATMQNIRKSNIYCPLKEYLDADL